MCPALVTESLCRRIATIDSSLTFDTAADSHASGTAVGLVLAEAVGGGEDVATRDEAAAADETRAGASIPPDGGHPGKLEDLSEEENKLDLSVPFCLCAFV